MESPALAELENRLRAYILSTYRAQLHGVTSLDADDSFLDRNVFDSLSFIAFLQVIQEMTGLVVPAYDANPQRLGTLAMVRDYIHARLRRA